jgi:fibronectin type 3 domain-containing protein
VKAKLLRAGVVLVIAVALITWVLLARVRRQPQRFHAPHSVKLTWVGSAGARTYNVYRSQTSGTYGGPLVTGLASPIYTDGTVAAGQTYFYAVTAVNAFGESGKSREVRAVIPNP